MRILITGSRTWDSADVIHDELDLIAMTARTQREPITVVHGGARGVDRMSGTWVRQCIADGWPVTEEIHVPDWDGLGKRAGMVRNQHMVDLGADVCLAFIRDNSPGATACARMAETAGIRTVRTHYPA
jgi:hypothetical protein